jgi:hypothetical protein
MENDGGDSRRIEKDRGIMPTKCFSNPTGRTM